MAHRSNISDNWPGTILRSASPKAGRRTWAVVSDVWSVSKGCFWHSNCDLLCCAAISLGPSCNINKKELLNLLWANDCLIFSVPSSCWTHSPAGGTCDPAFPKNCCFSSCLSMPNNPIGGVWSALSAPIKNNKKHKASAGDRLLSKQFVKNCEQRIHVVGRPSLWSLVKCRGSDSDNWDALQLTSWISFKGT